MIQLSLQDSAARTGRQTCMRKLWKLLYKMQSSMELIGAKSAIATLKTVLWAHRRSALRRSVIRRYFGLVGTAVEFFRHSGVCTKYIPYLGDSIADLGKGQKKEKG